MPLPFAAVKASNVKYAPSFRPVIVVFGGTSGIGSGIVRAFATHVPPQTGVHIVIVGRSKTSADALIASLPPNANSRYDFLRVDALLIHDLRVFIREQIYGALGLTKINYLVLSQGELNMDNKARTSEGFHPSIALMYGRARAALDLAPLLQAAASSGEDARIMAIAAPGTGGAIDLDDIATEQMGTLARRGAMVTYTDIYVASLAKQFPDLAVMHVGPGVVKSGLKRGLPLYIKAVWAFGELFMAISAEESGERMMLVLVDPKSQKGAFVKDHHNQPVAPSKFITEETREVVWKHIKESSDL
ncbi:hypothetical protein EXIGLDRAFT_761382 [Exidia glandulosa HHB12029]|uniref:NAD(P)-binding protein n=1 Tax=Exidia glandulosa HHB12029 TaxID=1314781 RepID=A0A165NJI8_EXIGL|nr:hypothetical protein EXIGLDRAFT_761382 [Exidia glandulosa HHB12029]